MMIVTQDELYITQAPRFDFELNSDEILAKALEAGFVKKIGEDKYQINIGYDRQD